MAPSEVRIVSESISSTELQIVRPCNRCETSVAAVPGVHSIDSSGRVLLPEKLRKYAGIDREVVMVGVADRAEIWDRARWEKFESENDDHFDALDVVLVGGGGPDGKGGGG